MEEPIESQETAPKEEHVGDIKDTARKLKENVRDFAKQGARLAKEKCKYAGGKGKLKVVTASRCWGLFDLSFHGVAAATIIRIAYVLSIIFSALWGWRLVRLGLSHDRGGLGLMGVLLFFTVAFIARALVSVAMAVLKTEENTTRLVQLAEQSAGISVGED